MKAKSRQFESPRESRWQAGTSLAEALIAVAIIGLALGAMMTLNGNQLRLVKSGRDTNSASLVVQERVEKLRTLAWPDLTDSTYMSDSYLAIDTKAAPILNDLSETLVISRYPASGAASSLHLTKKRGQAVQVVSTGTGLDNEKLVRADITVNWKTSDGQRSTRSISTLLAKSGVNRNDVPAMGPVAGGAFDAFSTPAPTGATPTPTPTPTATPTPSPDDDSGNGNGNGNGHGYGRGNVNGEHGKG